MKYLYLVFLISVKLGEVTYEVPKSIELVLIKNHNFLDTYNFIRNNSEGNYVNHPNDRGGETYGGIARKIHPNWYGWKYINKSLKRHEIVEAAEPWVLDFYLDIWVREGFENIGDKELARNLFDFRIHSSPKTVSILTSRVLVQMGNCPVTVGDNWISEDFNEIDAKEFILRLKIQRLILFNRIVTKNPNQKIFYKGWVTRIETI